MTLNLPEHLIGAVARGRCVAFAGAGVSIPSGLPGWKELVSSLVEEIRRIDPTKAREFSEQLKSGQLTQAAQYAKVELGERAYFDVLLRLYRTPAKPNVNHELLSQIPFRGLITTNFDKLIETACTLNSGVMPILFTPLSTSALASVLFSDRPFIFKFHGDIDHSESIILTRQDYDRVIFSSPHVKTFLHSVFSQNTVLFIGYSLSDPDFDLLLTELSMIFEGATPPHYALLPAPDGSTIPLFRCRCWRMVVRVPQVLSILQDQHTCCVGRLGVQCLS